ncbi:MAG: hypothetical protein V1905_02540 [bacterium]
MATYSPISSKRFLRGLSSYLAVLITAILLSLAMGTASIVLGGIKMTRGIGDSIIAFYAADTGIEESLYMGKTITLTTMENGASYFAVRTVKGAGCAANNYCIVSTGYFNNPYSNKARRAIQIMR